MKTEKRRKLKEEKLKYVETEIINIYVNSDGSYYGINVSNVKSDEAEKM